MRLCEELSKYSRQDIYPFHMPGHKRNPLFFGASGEAPGGVRPPEMVDITEIDGFDDLQDARGIIREEQQRAAGIFGSDRCFFLVNGSTCGNLAGISATVPMGGRVLVFGDCHQSIYNGLRLRQARMTRIRRCSHDWPPASFFRQADKKGINCNFDLVVITYPTYEGNVCDLASLARACHDRGIPLMADAAHGAHLRFAQGAGGEPGFPQDAVSAGADIVVNSLHKTLPSMTGTSLLHVNEGNGLVDINKIEYYLHTYQTTSPSYVLMSSISSCLRFLEEGAKDADGRTVTAEEWFVRYVNCLGDFYKESAAFKHIGVLSPEHRDPGKIIIFPPGGMSGTDLMDTLRRDYRLELERAIPEYALAMTSVCDTDQGFDRLFSALKDIDDHVKI